MEATGNHLAEAEDMHLNPQGDSRDPASEQGAPSGNGDLRRKQQNGYWCRFLHRTKASRNVGIIVGIIVGILVSMALVGITVGITLVYLGKTNQSEGTPASAQEVMSASTPLLEVNSSCPDGSIQYEDCCYRFSESETKWNLSQDICSLYGGVPFVPRTPQELKFIHENKPPGDYWIFLRREKATDVWKAPGWLEIKNNGLCATLNYDTVSSTDCDQTRLQICCIPHPAFSGNQRH